MTAHRIGHRPVFWLLAGIAGCLSTCTAQPPTTTTPASVVEEFFTFIRQGEYAQASALCTAASTKAIGLGGLREEQSKAFLFLAALSHPTPDVQMEVDRLEVQGATATVPFRKVIRRTWSMVLRKEDLRWKVDLLATLQMSPPDTQTPEALIREFDRRLRSVRASRQLPLMSASSIAQIGLDDALEESRGHDFDTAVDILILIYVSPSTKIEQGPPEVVGDRATVSVTKRIDLSGTLVMTKEDGLWRIDPLQSGLRSGYFTEEDVQFFRAAGAKEACEKNLRRILVGLLMYVQDYRGRLPAADRWVDALRPYVKDERVFRCPGRPGTTIGYALNPRLAGKSLQDVHTGTRPPLVFEIAQEEGAAPGAKLPIVAVHEGLTPVGFADGRVEWMTPEEALRLLNPRPVRSPKLFRFPK